METPVSIIKVKGLSDEQCQALNGIKFGDTLLFVKQYPAGANNDDEAESEDGDEDDNDDEQGEQDEGNEDDDEEEDEGMNSVHGSDSQDGDAVDEDDEDEPASAEEDEEEEEDTVNSSCLYLVNGLSRDEDGTITNLDLLKLQYDAKYDVEHAFNIYGTEVTHFAATDCIHHDDSECEALMSIEKLGKDGGLQDYTFRINPDGDFIRTMVLQNRLCPANCSGGWLTSLEQLTEYVEPEHYTTDATLAHRPVCPVCMGLDLLKEQQTLRLQLEAHQFDIGDVVEFLGRLNIRRRQVGHRFYQFDEREWAMHFDDMDSEDDGNGGAGADGGQWEQWADALDPNAEVHVKYRPAADAVIAALPKMAYRDVPVVEKEEKAEACVVCQVAYATDSIVAVLPCKHFSCAGACTEQWLKQYDTCPTCRSSVTPGSKGAKDGAAMAELAADGAAVAGLNGAEQMQVTADVLMSDH